MSVVSGDREMSLGSTNYHVIARRSNFIWNRKQPRYYRGGVVVFQEYFRPLSLIITWSDKCLYGHPGIINMPFDIAF